ncbi:MAG: hypothetical protein IPM69_06105 [Ignavibacteria bacterium]|nr:hypothetical protein [Ignavibacteria bacterium]
MTLIRFMQGRIQRIFLIGILLSLGSYMMKADENLEITKEFNLITSANAAGYFKPFFTSIGESFNSNTYTVARFVKNWQIGLDISVCGMFIPESQLTFDAALPEQYGTTGITQTSELRGATETRNRSGMVVQPTIYGGISTPTFSAAQRSRGPLEGAKDLKQPGSVTYLEGNNISFMSGLPSIQLSVGFPSQTRLRLRFLPIPISGNSATYFGMMVSQQFNQWVGLFANDSLAGIALNVGYHSLSRTKGISISSFAVGLHASKTWYSGLSVYGGIQYEGMSGSLNFVREQDNSTTGTINDSPFDEIRLQKDLNVNVESFTSIRIGTGVSFKVGAIELHADTAYASQPVLSAGITFWFLSNDTLVKPTTQVTSPTDTTTQPEGVKP